MAWVKISDDFDENSKFDHVGALGIAVWLAGMAYCNRNLTDGLIHRSRVSRLVSLDGIGYVDDREGQNPAAVTLGLILEAELWHADGHECPKCPQPGPHHFIVHDYLEYQPSREEVLAKRAAEAARKAGARSQKRKPRKDSAAESPGVSQADSTRTPDSGPDEVRANSEQRPTPPVPVPLPTDVGRDASPNDSVVEPTQTKNSTRKKPARPLPDDWAPNDNHREFAAENKIDLDAQVEAFRLHATANDRRQVDWNASFRMWLGKAVEYGGIRPPAGGRQQVEPYRPKPQALCNIDDAHVAHDWTMGRDLAWCPGRDAA